MSVYLNASNYNAELYFNGNNNYYSNNASVAFSVVKADADLTLDIADITYGDYLLVVNSLSDNLNTTLKLVINNNIYYVSSNSIFKVPDLFEAGNYSAELTFEIYSS